MQILLVFSIEDPFIVTLKNSILKCGYSVKCCRNIHETHEAFKKLNYDLVFIDCRRGRTPSTGGTTATPATTTTTTTSTNPTVGGSGGGGNNISSSSSQYDYANIVHFIRRLYHYTVIVALTHNYDDKNTPSVLPLLKLGFSRTFAETTSLNRCINELLNLENGEVSSVRRLQAAHALFTALEYTNDPIEITNDQFKLVYVNNAFEKLTGFSLNDMSGREFNEFHRLEPSQQLSKKLSPGNAWECSLPFPKLSGELAHHLSITIPVIVQGETNKIQNYVTIAYLPDRPLPSFKGLKRPQSMYNQSEYAGTLSLASESSSTSRSQESTPLRKPNSFVLPKKNYDFDRFASESLASTSDLEPRTPPLAPSQSITNSIDGGAGGSQFFLDQEPAVDTLTAKLPTLLTNPSLDFAASSNSNNNHNLIQRKRSYDIQSSYGGQVHHNQGNMLGGVNYEARRNSSTHRLHHQPSAIEAPIRKVINFITMALEKSNKDFVKQNLENALDILKSTELYNPSMVLDSTSDMHTSDLVSGLMSNGLQRKFQKMSVFEIRQHSFNSASSLSHNYVKNLTPEINEILQKEESWNFDIIALERLTNHRPLVTLGYKIFNRFDVCEYLKIEETVLVNWLTLMESNYRQTNPYHNSTHASDVLHATAYFLSTSRITEIFEAEDRVGSLIAAVIHDLNHPGRTNAFLCNSNNDLAILYNDQAVLENHHAALAFQITRQNDDTNIFKNLTREEYRAVRSVIIDMVLATEMSKHFEHLNKFMNKFNDEKAPVSVKNNVELLKQQDNKVLIKRILIKCADVNNPCRPLDICQEWANRIAHEYFDQTDEEKAKSLPVVMPTFDRVSCNIPKAQISFIEYFITDMFDAWDDFVDIPEVMFNLSANTSYWRECRDEQEQRQSGGESGSNNNNSSSRGTATLDRSKSIAEDNEIDQ